MLFVKRILAVLTVVVVASCGPADKDLAEIKEPIGEFKLGFNVVVADDAKMAPPSRRATEEQLEAAMKKAVDERFSRYNGTQLYHIAITIDAYSLAIPGVPLVFNPKSVMVIGATVWDDAKGGKINTEPKQFTFLERASEKTVLSSGMTQNKEEQLENLVKNGARLVEDWMRDNPDWFAKK